MMPSALHKDTIDRRLTPHSKARWFALALLTLVYTCHYIDRSIIGIVLELLKREFTLSDKQLGALSGLIYGSAFAITCIPIGYLADRVNRVRLLSAILLVWSGLTALSAMATGFISLAMARFAIGAAESGGSPTSLSLISDYFSPKERPTAIGCFFVSSGIGSVFSFLVGGHVAAEWGWRAAFLIAGIPGIILSVVIFLFLKEPVRGATDDVTNEAKEGKITSAPRSVFIHLFIAAAISVAVMAGIWSWSASFFIRLHHLEIKQAGIIVALGTGFFGSLGTFCAGPLSQRISRQHSERLVWVPLMGSLILVPAGVAFQTVDNTSLAIILFMFWCFVSALFIAPVFALVANLTTSHRRGRVLSLLQVSNNLLGAGCGPFFVGYVSDAIGGPQSLRTALIALTVLCCWGAVHYAVIFYKLREQARQVLH